MMISLKRITKNVMETDKKKNSGRKATRGSVRDARETFERRLCCSLLVRSQIPDEWKLGKLENSRTTGNSLLARQTPRICVCRRTWKTAGKTHVPQSEKWRLSVDGSKKAREPRLRTGAPVSMSEIRFHCESLCTGSPEQWIRAVGRFEKKIRERNQGERNNREEARTIVFALMNHPCQELAMPLPNWPLELAELQFFSQKLCKWERMRSGQCLSFDGIERSQNETERNHFHFPGKLSFKTSVWPRCLLSILGAPSWPHSYGTLGHLTKLVDSYFKESAYMIYIVRQGYFSIFSISLTLKLWNSLLFDQSTMALCPYFKPGIKDHVNFQRYFIFSLIIKWWPSALMFEARINFMLFKYFI